MKPRHRTSIEELREIMTDFLTRRNASPEFIAGYLAGQEFGGYLDPKKPSWLRDHAALLYAIPTSSMKPEPPQSNELQS